MSLCANCGSSVDGDMPGKREPCPSCGSESRSLHSISDSKCSEDKKTCTVNKKQSKTNYILIDFENVQPKNLEILKGHDFNIIIFVGEKQTKISFDLAVAMQSLGKNAEYVKINGNGPNALDFHIAFYIGTIATKDQNCFFHIVSKDKGFDPLIRHLKTKKIYAQRKKDVSEIPLLKISGEKSKSERVNAIVEFLKVRGAAKPRTEKTLSNSINSLFSKTLEEKELSALVAELIKRKVVIKNGTKVSYHL
jgi:hypothetical protein